VPGLFERARALLSGRGRSPDPFAGGPMLWAIQPPEGVRLTGSGPSKTGEGGQGVVARYSDGTTASAMVNSDGSVCVLFFRDGQNVPAIRVEPANGEASDSIARFTWSRKR
jgi:hypothetical protein